MKQFSYGRCLKHLYAFFFAFTLLLFSSCYPDEPDSVEEYDVVYTNYTPGFNFNVALSYSLPDQVLLLDTNRLPDGPPEFIDDQFGDVILSNIRDNLNAKGWTEVEEASNPDVIILASAFDETFLYYYDWGYWCWYYPGCFPGWGWGYPGYNPGYVTGFKTGTILIQMTEPDALQNEEIPVVWTGVLNGLLQGQDASIINRIEQNLDQAFTQPPFDNN